MIEHALHPYYDLLRGLHMICVIAWMAGLFYLPRLFVYHVEAGETPEIRGLFCLMEYRLLTYIMHPACVASWITGVLLLLSLPWEGAHVWMLIKLAAVVAMTLYHVFLTYQTRVFARQTNTYSGRFYRIINEIPTVLMIIIVVMATLEPFGILSLWGIVPFWVIDGNPT